MMNLLKKIALKIGLWLVRNKLSSPVKLSVDDMKIYEIRPQHASPVKHFFEQRKYGGLLYIISVLLLFLFNMKIQSALFWSIPILLMTLINDTKLEFNRSKGTLIIYHKPSFAKTYEPIYEIPLSRIEECIITKHRRHSDFVTLVMKIDNIPQYSVEGALKAFAMCPELEEEDKNKILSKLSTCRGKYDALGYIFHFNLNKKMEKINNFLQSDAVSLTIEEQYMGIKILIILIILYPIFLPLLLAVFI